jgi:hypothetical protein
MVPSPPSAELEAKQPEIDAEARKMSRAGARRSISIRSENVRISYLAAFDFDQFKI